MHLPRVLVVDDDPEVCRTYALFLSAHGCMAATAPSAERALEHIRSARPDVILLDISLPDISGLALFQALRADPKTKRLPVLLMTGLTTHKDLLEAAAKGADADAILTKPFDFAHLLARVHTALSAAPYRIDSAAEKIWIKGRELPLTHTHFRLLRALLQTPGPLSADHLLTSIWSNSDNPNVVHVTAHHLRRILRRFPEIRLERSDNHYRVTIS